MNKVPLDTEQKIKEAARQIFLKKGYDATKTRDIAEAANSNIALVNYYFRSKQQLYEMIMLETIEAYFSSLVDVLNEDNLSLQDKLQQFVTRSIDFHINNPMVAHFVLQSIRNCPEEFVAKLTFVDKVKQSAFITQYKEAAKMNLVPPIHPLQLLMNLMSLVVFPFVAKPIFSLVTEIDETEFVELMNERKKLIPQWIEAMLMVKS